MAKRSPILGYNHNVRYRGLVFHVQTEDSGLLNPHLFTHLFHEGVIVSTRKLVYDAGSNEEAIKALMQAQHKAVMKDLRKGTFDDKIDQYLSGTPGLEPRGTGAAPQARGERAPTEQAPPPDETIAAAQAAISVSEGSPIEIVNEGLSEPIELPVKDTTQPARTKTAERTSPKRTAPPPPEDLGNAPTYQGSAADMAAAVAAANAGAPRTSTAQRVGTAPTSHAITPPAIARTQTPFRDSSPVIEISVDDDDDDHSGRLRGPRDTAVEMVDHEGVPRAGSDSIPPTIPVQKSRPASHAASALPAMKPPSRPAITPPIVTRPATGPRGNPDESQPIEIYQPAPPSVEPPPGERPGQYSVKRGKDGAPIREQTGRIAAQSAPAIPSGLARPRPGSGAPGHAVPGNVPKEPTPGNRPPTGPASTARPPSAGARVPAPPQPPNRAHATAPITNRSPSPANPSNNSGVVMTRPAVIVGAPPKPPTATTTQRVRKAREDEGRGFGQGLISEKSLDEVILAYLSEDAEEK